MQRSSVGIQVLFERIKVPACNWCECVRSSHCLSNLELVTVFLCGLPSCHEFQEKVSDLLISSKGDSALVKDVVKHMPEGVSQRQVTYAVKNCFPEMKQNNNCRWVLTADTYYLFISHCSLSPSPWFATCGQLNWTVYSVVAVVSFTLKQ